MSKRFLTLKQVLNILWCLGRLTVANFARNRVHIKKKDHNQLQIMFIPYFWELILKRKAVSEVHIISNS